MTKTKSMIYVNAQREAERVRMVRYYYSSHNYIELDSLDLVCKDCGGMNKELSNIHCKTKQEHNEMIQGQDRIARLSAREQLQYKLDHK